MHILSLACRIFSALGESNIMSLCLFAANVMYEELVLISVAVATTKVKCKQRPVVPAVERTTRLQLQTLPRPQSPPTCMLHGSVLTLLLTGLQNLPALVRPARLTPNPN